MFCVFFNSRGFFQRRSFRPALRVAFALRAVGLFAEIFFFFDLAIIHEAPAVSGAGKTEA